MHDEGMVIADGIIDGLQRPVALIGVAEKGYVSLELIAPGMGGHSSMPPNETAVTKLATAIVKIQDNPLEPALDGPVRELFETLGAHMPFPQSFLFSNLWLFDGLVTGQLASKDSTNALVRTTTAPTMISGSIKDNVLPTEARAVINFRVHPKDSVQAVKDHIRKVIDDDDIRIEVAPNTLYSEPSAISPTSAKGYQLIEKTLNQHYPNIYVAPSLFIAATDSRHYRDLTKNIYRFTPYWMTAGDRQSGIDERISSKLQSVRGLFSGFGKGSQRNSVRSTRTDFRHTAPPKPNKTQDVGNVGTGTRGTAAALVSKSSISSVSGPSFRPR